MDAPFGILFLKKAELYNLIKRLDKQSFEIIDKYIKDENYTANIPSTWLIEKNIFKWSYWGHKHLGSPIKYEHFKLNGTHSKLKDFELCKDNTPNTPCILKKEYVLILKHNKPKKIFQNIIIRGFADPYYENNNINNKTIDSIDGIILNKEGLLLGEIIYNTEDSNSHFIYSIYSFLMDHVGAWLLLIIFSLTFIIAIIIPFLKDIFNVHVELIKQLLNIIKYLFSLLFYHF